MTRAYVTSGSPNGRSAPDAEYQDETWADWIRRQNNPKKKKAPRSRANDPEGNTTEGNGNA